MNKLALRLIQAGTWIILAAVAVSAAGFVVSPEVPHWSRETTAWSMLLFYVGSACAMIGCPILLVLQRRRRSV